MLWEIITKLYRKHWLSNQQSIRLSERPYLYLSRALKRALVCEYEEKCS